MDADSTEYSVEDIHQKTKVEMEATIVNFCVWMTEHFIEKTMHLPPEFFSLDVCSTDDFTERYPDLLDNIQEQTFWAGMDSKIIDLAIEALESAMDETSDNVVKTFHPTYKFSYAAASLYLKSLL